MSQRKVVQVISSESVIICDDGTVWALASTMEGWVQLQSIPQDETAKAPQPEAGPVKITLEFESEAEANRWLNQRPYTPPTIADGPGEFCDENVIAAVKAYHSCGSRVDDNFRMRRAFKAAGARPSCGARQS